MISPKVDAYYEKLREGRRQAYRRQNAQTLVYPELIFVGDSITEWFDVEKWLTLRSSWANRGIAASNSQHVLDHVDVLVFGASVREVVLLIGTNDLGYSLPLAQTIDNVRQLIETIKADYPPVTIHLLEVLPVNESSQFAETVDVRTNANIQALNQAYADLADQYPFVNLVPTYQAFLDDQGQLAVELTKDGLHLSEQGYEVFAGILGEVVR